jgi:hypothetical protein
VTALREAERQGQLPKQDAQELLRLALKDLGVDPVIPLGTKKH